MRRTNSLSDPVSQKQELPRIDSSSLGDLFKAFVEIEQMLDEQNNNERFSSLHDADALLDFQSELMAAAIKTKATSLEDLVFKMALWRWDYAEIADPTEPMPRSDAVAYSVFRDLVEITNKRSVLKEIDQ